MCRLARDSTVLAHAQNGRTYDIFFQSMLRRDLVCMKSCQSLHCSRTYTKWVSLWHLLSVNAQTSLSMRAVSPDPSLLSHMHKMGVHRHILSVNAETSLSVCAVLPEPSLLSHMHKMGVHTAYFFSQCLNKPKHACSLARNSLLSHMH